MTNPKILVLGDLIIDEYIYGDCIRISPEAPVPVVSYDKSNVVQGGAGNVVENLRALGADVKFWCDTKSCHKTRIVAGHQHVVRLDRDDLTEVDPPANLAKMVVWCDLVLISDYKKGVVNGRLLDQLGKCLSVCRKSVLIDPYDGRCDYLETPTLMKPNKKETESVTGILIVDDLTLAQAAQKYMSKSGALNLVITLGADGMALFDRNKYLIHPYRVKSVAQQVFDVTGAGDTVIAVLAYIWATSEEDKLSKQSAVNLANRAAGIVCSKLGTATISHYELFETTTFRQEHNSHDHLTV